MYVGFIIRKLVINLNFKKIVSDRVSWVNKMLEKKSLLFLFIFEKKNFWNILLLLDNVDENELFFWKVRSEWEKE